MKNPQYLGDSVYAQQDEVGVVLTTGSHYDSPRTHPDNQCIYLEPEVLQSLLLYIKTHYPTLYDSTTN